jgi:hypothetical protein
MTIQTFTAGQKLTALQMNTLQASDFNFTRNVRTDSSYTFTLSDKGKLVESTNAGSAVFTIPLNSTAEFSVGDRIDTLLASDGSLQIVGASGVTLYAEGDLTTISSKWTRVTLIKRATDSWVMTGSGMSVQTVELDNLAVTEAKLADSSVTSAKIADGTIVNADINASAAIALSKLASGTSAQVVIANSGGVPTYTTLSGDVTIGNTGVTAIGSGKVTSSMILDGTIVDGDVSSSASIALSKLATGALPTAITVASANIVDGTIVNADISSSAAIAYSKLSLGTSIVNADIATGAAIAASKISGTAITAADSGTVTSTMIADGTIVNADISSSASIAYSKLNLNTSIVNGDVSASASIVDTKLATISTAGKVSNSATTATSSNTASAIVARDSNGDFAAGKLTASSIDVTGITETALIVGTFSASVNVSFVTNPTVYVSASASADWTINVRGTSAGATLNSVLTTGQIATITFLATIGATQKLPTTFKVDGTTLTPKWMGGTAPASGNINSIDAYTYAIIKTADATFTVLASQTKFA